MSAKKKAAMSSSTMQMPEKGSLWIRKTRSGTVKATVLKVEHQRIESRRYNDLDNIESNLGAKLSAEEYGATDGGGCWVEVDIVTFVETDANGNSEKRERLLRLFLREFVPG